jgi:cytochrome c-type biogenesis protein CcmF
VESAKNAMLLTFPLLTISITMLIIMLLNSEFEVAYVATVTSRSMPAYLKVTALWGGQPGSLLFWTWLMSIFASVVSFRDWSRDREFLPWVTVVALATIAVFLLLVIGFENPFDRLWALSNGAVEQHLFRPEGAVAFTPSDGQGMNPYLRHVGMIIHPPMQYLGFVSFLVPYSFAIAALVTGRTDSRWIRVTRKWTLWAWLFLSLGLVLGMRWAYDVLGWGGYWGWDPSENAALLPWLAATPFLHSVMIQEKQGMFKRWNMILVILTYNVMIFGTFLIRSGLLSSVHAFAQSAIGPILFSLIAVNLVVSVSLLIRRWKSLDTEAKLLSWLSREGFFLLNNLIFIGLLVIVLLGVLYPLISEASGGIGDAIPALKGIFTGQKVTVGPDWYEMATGPLWAALLFLMGVCPLSAWRVSTAKSLGRNIWKPTVFSLVVPVWLAISGMESVWAILAFWLAAMVISVTAYEFYKGAMARSRKPGGKNFLVELGRLVVRNRRRYGGYMIHFGIVLMALGIIGIEMFQTQTQATIASGERITLGDYAVQYDELAIWNSPDNRNVARAVVSVYKDDEYVGQVFPRRDYYYEASQQVTIPGVRSTAEDDLYVLLVDWEDISISSVTFKVYHNPLVSWLWTGALVLIVGTTVAAWPEKEPETLRVPARAARKAA